MVAASGRDALPQAAPTPKLIAADVVSDAVERGGFGKAVEPYWPLLLAVPFVFLWLRSGGGE
jgi:hypothetical protein